MSERQIMSQEDIQRALARIAHEVLERNRGGQDLVLVGIHTRGVPLARRLAQNILQFEGHAVPVAELDIGMYRDDLSQRSGLKLHPTHFPVNVQDQTVVLLDDVLYTGRTVRAALDALKDYGRPKQVQLAILIDRGHRELPIRADYVGKNIPTGQDEQVQVRLVETDGLDQVALVRRED